MTKDTLIRVLIRETLIAEMRVDRFDPDLEPDVTKQVSYADLEIMPELEAQGVGIPDIDGLRAGDEVFVKKCTTSQCAAWVAEISDQTVGNAWHAHNAPGSLKFSAYDNIDAYKYRAEKVFSVMNSINPVENLPMIMTQFKTVLAGLGEKLANDFDVEYNSTLLEMGDIVGLFHKNSNHYPDAFFEGATDYSINQEKPLGNTGPAFYDTASGELWNESMLGKNIKFTLFRPFGMNTHLGIVGGTYAGEPIIFHNVGGKINARLAKNMSEAKNSNDRLVWGKTLPTSQAATFLPSWMRL